MSVINDMLRDLEQRKAPEREALQVIASSSSLIETQHASYTKIVLLIALILLVCGTYFYFGDEPAHTKSKAGSFDENTTETPAEFVSEAVILEERALVQTQVKGEVTALKLSPKPKPVSKPKQDIVSNPKIRESIAVKSIPSLSNTTKAPVRLKSKVAPYVLDQNNARLANELFQKNEARKAYRLLYDFMSAHQVDLKTRIVLVSHLLQDERIAEAGDILVSTPVTRSPELRQLKARWYVFQNENNMALHTLRSNLPVLEEYPDYYALLASYYQRFGFAAKAAETYEYLLTYDEDSANWWAGLAIAFDSSKRYQDATDTYQRALEIPGLSIELIEYIENRLGLLGVNNINDAR